MTRYLKLAIALLLQGFTPGRSFAHKNSSTGIVPPLILTLGYPFD